MVSALEAQTSGLRVFKIQKKKTFLIFIYFHFLHVTQHAFIQSIQSASIVCVCKLMVQKQDYKSTTIHN